jgi:transcriptional regulator with XRE-family HTH domain
MDPGELIASARRRAGMTQLEVARRAGTSQPVVSAYERGHRDPTYGTLRRLIAAAGGTLRLDAAPRASSDLPPPADLAEHGRRLEQVLLLADSFPARRRSRTMRAPRIVSR